MLASLLARYHDQGERQSDRYGAWSAALRQLRNDGTAARCEIHRLDNFLQQLPDEQHLEALQDLIAEHLRLSWQTGQGLLLDPYLAVFGPKDSALGSPALVPAALVEDEFLARHQLPHGDTPALEEYRRRFPNRPDILARLARRRMDGGRYVKLHMRGLGAMGEVWEACDLHLRRWVAIKAPREGLANHPESLRRFEQEALVTAGLEHPGIVSVHEFRRHEGAVPFYVMRLVRGKTLSERIRDYHRSPAGRPPVEQRLLWGQLLQSLAMVCDAIAYANECGVLHRDLKPGNIILGDFGEVVVLDWGMAQRLPTPGERPVPAVSGTEPVHETIVGTPDYMPPEQVSGHADVRSEVFGLGAILYETLTGRSPHGWADGARPADWSGLVREARFQQPRQISPETPRPLEAICLKALARDPGQRYQAAAQLARDLRCHLAGEPVSAWPESSLSRIWRRLRGRP